MRSVTVTCPQRSERLAFLNLAYALIHSAQSARTFAQGNEPGRVDFHALLHTFASILANVGVSELVRVKLARHSEWRQADRYTDPASLPLFAEMERFASALPSSIPSPISGKKGPKTGKVVQMDVVGEGAKIIPMASQTVNLTKAVPSWESVDMVPEGGLEPPCG